MEREQSEQIQQNIITCLDNWQLPVPEDLISMLCEVVVEYQRGQSISNEIGGEGVCESCKDGCELTDELESKLADLLEALKSVCTRCQHLEAVDRAITKAGEKK